MGPGSWQERKGLKQEIRPDMAVVDQFQDKGGNWSEKL
jgi:uncharacterized protein (DUF4415 family)